MRTGHPYLSASSYSPLSILNIGLHAIYTLTGVLSRNGNAFAWLHAMTCVRYCEDVLRTGHFFSPFQTKLNRASYTGFEKGKWERFDVDFDSGIPNLIIGHYAPSI